jgi:hypothetical protein
MRVAAAVVQIAIKQYQDHLVAMAVVATVRDILVRKPRQGAMEPLIPVVEAVVAHSPEELSFQEEQAVQVLLSFVTQTHSVQLLLPQVAQQLQLQVALEFTNSTVLGQLLFKV